MFDLIVSLANIVVSIASMIVSIISIRVCVKSMEQGDLKKEHQKSNRPDQR